LGTLRTHSRFVVEVPRKRNALSSIEYPEVRLRIAGKAVAVVFAGETLKRTVRATVVERVCEVSWETCGVAETVNSEEETLIAISAVGERSTRFAFGRTARANSGFVIEVPFLGYTSLGSGVHLSVIFQGIAGNTGTVIAASVAVVRTYVAS